MKSNNGPVQALLAIDIGNTNTHLAIFLKSRVIKTFTYATSAKIGKALIKKFCAGFSIKDSIIVSVVPAATKKIEKTLVKIFGQRPYIVGKNITLPMRNCYRRPQALGQDRLVNAFAASQIYGAPVIVISLGTCLTFNIISRNGAYEGGMIFPGLNMCLEALKEKTALLPKLKPEKPAEFIARSTKNSILSGVVYGLACLCDELTRKIKKRSGQNTKVIATGGNSGLLARYCQEINKIDPLLSLRGLNLLYSKGKFIC